MRIWDVKPEILCDNHLLGEHRELHAVWNILTLQKKGYAKHPETKRWEGKLKALYNRHQEQVQEIKKRGWKHYSELDKSLATGSEIQDQFIDPIDRQMELLKEKPCKCFTDHNQSV